MTGMMTMAQFAEAIGSTYYTVYGWVTKHGLPCVKIGAKRYIEISAYEEWKRSKTSVETKPRSKAQTIKEVYVSPIKVSKRIADTMERIY